METEPKRSPEELYEALEQNQHELTGVMAFRAQLDQEWQELQEERQQIIQELQNKQ